MKVTIELQAGRGCFHFAPRSPLVAVADSISLRRELLQGRVLYERFQRFQCKDFSFGAAQQLLHVLATDAEAPSANARNHLKTRFASSRCAQRPQMLNLVTLSRAVPSSSVSLLQSQPAAKLVR